MHETTDMLSTLSSDALNVISSYLPFRDLYVLTSTSKWLYKFYYPYWLEKLKLYYPDEYINFLKENKNGEIIRNAPYIKFKKRHEKPFYLKSGSEFIHIKNTNERWKKYQALYFAIKENNIKQIVTIGSRDLELGLLNDTATITWNILEFPLYDYQFKNIVHWVDQVFLNAAYKAAISKNPKVNLIAACQYNQIKVIQQYIESSNGWPKEEPLSNKLHKAASLGRLDILKLLLPYYEQGSQEKLVVSGLPNDLLIAACKQGHLNIVNYLLDSFKENNNAQVLTDAFIAAIEYGHLEIVETLVNQEKLNLDSIANRCTPVGIAVRYQRHSIVKLLLDKGADATNMQNMAIDPLHLAIRKQDFLMVKIIIENTSKFNKEIATTLYGLKEVIKLSNLQIWKYLQEKGLATCSKSTYFSLGEEGRNKLKNYAIQAEIEEVLSPYNKVTPLEKAKILLNWYIQQSPRKHWFSNKDLARKILVRLDALSDSTFTIQVFETIISELHSSQSKATQINPNGHFGAIIDLIRITFSRPLAEDENSIGFNSRLG